MVYRRARTGYDGATAVMCRSVVFRCRFLCGTGAYGYQEASVLLSVLGMKLSTGRDVPLLLLVEMAGG